MSRTVDPESLPGFGQAPGTIVQPAVIPLIIDPSLPPRIAMAASNFNKIHPSLVTVSFGALRDWLIAVIEGYYFAAYFPRSRKLEDLCNKMKECILQLDENNRFQGLGFSECLYNFQEYDNMEAYKPTEELKQGVRLLLTDKDKELVTETQYRLQGDFTEMFDIYWTDNPRKVRAVLKEGKDPMNGFWNVNEY